MAGSQAGASETVTLSEIAAKYHLPEANVTRVLASVSEGKWHSTLQWLAELGEEAVDSTAFTKFSPLGQDVKLPDRFPKQLFP